MFNLFLLRILFEIEKYFVQGEEIPEFLEKYSTPMWLFCYGILFAVIVELLGTMIYHLKNKALFILLPLYILMIFAVQDDKVVRQTKAAFFRFAGLSEGTRFLLITLIGVIGFSITFFGMKKAQNY